MKKRYFALCGRSSRSYLKHTLYYFEDEETSKLFFAPLRGVDTSRRQRRTSTAATVAKPRGNINLKDIKSVRFSARSDLPNNGRGLELHTSQRIYLVSCNDDDEYDAWTTIIAKVSGKKPRRTTISQESKSGRKKNKRRRSSRVERTTRHSRGYSFSTEDVECAATDDFLPDVETGENQKARGKSKEEKIEIECNIEKDVESSNKRATKRVSIFDGIATVMTNVGSSGGILGIATAMTNVSSSVGNFVTGKSDDFLHSTRDNKEDEDDDDHFDFFLTKGWVWKRGRTNTSWKRRWFQHQNGVLQYYVNEDSRKLKGELLVRGCSIQTEDENGFSISVPGRILCCKCDTREDAAMWIKAMKNFT